MSRRLRDDERGEVFPAAILFVAVLTTILIGVHVVLVALARTAVQSAADAAVVAAQIAEDGDRQAQGENAARIAMAGASGSVSMTGDPSVVVERERGVVTVVVFGGIRTPLPIGNPPGVLHLTAVACGPLEDVPVVELVQIDVWAC